MGNCMSDPIAIFMKIMDGYDPSKTYYQITYRVANKPDEDAGNARRKSLTDYLGSMFTGAQYRKFEDPAHVSTSAWIVEWAHDAEALYREIFEMTDLDENEDMLDVIRVDPDDSATNRKADKPD